MPDTVTVVGGGWSAGSVKRPPVGEGFVIGVNDAALYARVDLAVTMDRLWLENRWAALKSNGIVTYARHAAAKNVAVWRGLTTFECDHTSCEMSEDAGVANGTNSGLCALNVAYQMRPKHMVMIGFDMRRHPVTGASYWYPNYPWRPDGGTKPGKYREWAAQFGPFVRACRAAGIAIEARMPDCRFLELERAA